MKTGLITVLQFRFKPTEDVSRRCNSLLQSRIVDSLGPYTWSKVLIRKIPGDTQISRRYNPVLQPIGLLSIQVE